MAGDFNESFNDTGEKAAFIFKANQHVPHSWQIFMYKEEKKDYEPVGEYTLLDTGEGIDITEKKLSNLVRILNGKQDLIDIGNLTKTRILYNIVPKSSDSDPTKIIFREHDGQSVSKENAVLTIEKGVLKDEHR